MKFRNHIFLVNLLVTRGLDKFGSFASFLLFWIFNRDIYLKSAVLTFSIYNVFTFKAHCQIWWFFLKFTWKQFGMPSSCSQDLKFPWQQDFDILVFEICIFFTFCDKHVTLSLFYNFWFLYHLSISLLVLYWFDYFGANLIWRIWKYQEVQDVRSKMGTWNNQLRKILRRHMILFSTVYDILFIIRGLSLT